MPVRFVPTRALVVAIAVAATPHPLLAQPFTVRDSAGVRISTSTAPQWRPGAGWRLEPQPVLQIGAIEGSPAYMFSQIFQIRFVDGRHIAVVDARDPAIRLFDEHGRHVRTIGRQGGGSGEFMAAPTITSGRRSDVLAWDPLAQRLSWFGLDGRLRAERSFRETAAAAALRPLAIHDAWQLLEDGTIIATGPVSTGRRPGLLEFGRRVSIVAADGRRSVEIGTYPFERSIEFRPGYVFGDPFAERSPVAARGQPRRVIVGIPGHWELRAFGSDGALREIIRAAIPRRPLGAALVRQERDRVLARAGGFPDGSGADMERAFDRIGFPDSLPAMLRVLADETGHLWIQRWNTAGEDARFDIIDLQGRWLGSVDVPAALGEIRAAAAHHVAAVWRDELDVQYVRIYRLERDP
jgi:hypothetical protein